MVIYIQKGMHGMQSRWHVSQQPSTHQGTVTSVQLLMRTVGGR
mgnify:CR=1 FL=1